MADNDLLHTAEILKTALPYVDHRSKFILDLIVKLYEFMICYRDFRVSNLAACGFTSEHEHMDMEGLLNQIRPKCNEKEGSFVDRILSIFQAKRMFEMYNTYMSAMKTMQEFGGFGSDEKDEDADNVTKNFSGFDFSSIFGEGVSADAFSKSEAEPVQEGDHSADGCASDAINGNEAQDKDDRKDNINPGDDTPADNSKMFDMLKGMVPPEQISTFENLRMLFENMSYDDNKSEQNKE